MPTPTRKNRASAHPFRRVLAAALPLAAVAAAAIPANAAAVPSPCGRPTLSASKSVLKNGEAVQFAGAACGSRTRLMIQEAGVWHALGSVRLDNGGRFAQRVRVRIPDGVETVWIKATSPSGSSPRVRLTVQPPAAPAPAPTAAPAQAAAPAPTAVTPPAAAPTILPGEPGKETPPAAPVTVPVLPSPPVEPETPETPKGPGTGTEEPAAKCTLGPESSTAALPMTDPGCRLVASDTSAEANPLSFWSSIACVDPSRYSYNTTGGDTNPTAMGQSQGNEDSRRLTVMDGDELWGSRCELGENNSFSGRTTFYHQGEHLATYESLRLPENFPLSTNKWQVVTQMKQAQPSNAGGGAPILELDAREGHWMLIDSWNLLWTAPALKNTWTRIAWDVYYSNVPGQGRVQLSIDANGDGDFDDPGERSPVFQVQTLKTETEGPITKYSGLQPGQAIPSHLRVGPYHDPTIPCPAGTGCSVEVDNVQVLAPR